MIRKRIAEMLRGSIERCKREGFLPGDIEVEPAVEIPREKGHGDYATTSPSCLLRRRGKTRRRSPAASWSTWTPAACAAPWRWRRRASSTSTWPTGRSASELAGDPEGSASTRSSPMSAAGKRSSLSS